jgi:phage shock protein C
VYCSQCGKNIEEDAAFCPHCGSRAASKFRFAAEGAPRPFARYSSDKKIAGVCGGVARYFNLDSTLVRAVFLLCILLGGAVLPVYLVLWFVMPMDPSG